MSYQLTFVFDLDLTCWAFGEDYQQLNKHHNSLLFLENEVHGNGYIINAELLGKTFETIHQQEHQIVFLTAGGWEQSTVHAMLSVLFEEKYISDEAHEFVKAASVHNIYDEVERPPKFVLHEDEAFDDAVKMYKRERAIWDEKVLEAQLTCKFKRYSRVYPNPKRHSVVLVDDSDVHVLRFINEKQLAVHATTHDNIGRNPTSFYDSICRIASFDFSRIQGGHYAVRSLTRLRETAQQDEEKSAMPETHDSSKPDAQDGQAEQVERVPARTQKAGKKRFCFGCSST